MKIEGLDHPKVIALAAELDICIPQAIGHLELLWAFTAKKTPCGDIGKWPDSVIAHAAQWTGKAEDFVNALLSVGLLEQHNEHRLIIHDWGEHMPNWVRAKLKKTKGKVVYPHLNEDLNNDLRGDYKPSQAKPSEVKGMGGKDSPPKKTPKYTEEDAALAKYMIQRIRDVAPSAKCSERWPDDVRLMRERDGRTLEEIKSMFDWANKDEFWRANILCPATLRKQWIKLEAKRNGGGNGKSGRYRDRGTVEDRLNDTSWAENT